MKLVVRAILLVCVFFSNPTKAQESKQAKPPAMPKIHPGPEREKLSFLIGSYATESTVFPGSAVQAVGKGTSVVRWALDSMFIVIEEQSINPLMGDYKGFGMLGYDPSDSHYVLSMYNNFGDHPQYRGAFSGDTLILSTRVPSPRGAFDQKLFWYRAGDTIHLHIMNDKGTGFVPVIDQLAHPMEVPGHKLKDK